MNNKLVPITQRLIESGMSEQGGWNRKQLELIGVKWPPLRGWRRRAEGMLISESDAATFVRLKGRTIKVSKQVDGLSHLLFNFGDDR